MKIYISGKIAGDPDYKGKFARAAAQLERLGATVINPATAPEGLDKLDYMRICFAEMEAVDYVVFLPDWVESAGAKLERAWCDYVGVPTANWGDFRVDMLVRKSHGCTFRELLALEHPDKVDYGAWCTSWFYVGKGQLDIGRLNEGKELFTSLDFNMVSVNPLT